MDIMTPMRGEISMAPMMTAVLFMLSPMEAMKMARIRMHILVPLRVPPE